MKTTIIGGAGGVGACAAFNLLMRRHDEVVLVDRKPAMIASHVLDLEQVVAQRMGGSVRAGDLADLADSDVVVLTAAVPLTVNDSRLVYLEDNAKIIHEVLDALPDDFEGVLVMVTNPVDPLVTWAQRQTGIDRRRVVGYTLNDSLRLRTGVAKARSVDSASVEAWVLGEHGDACVPLWDRIQVDGAHVELSVGEREVAGEFLRTWYARHSGLDSGRTSTWTSGLGVARMISALSRRRGELWPASVVLDGEYGVAGVAISVPVTIAAGGARAVHEWDLSAEQSLAIGEAADLIRGLTDDIETTHATR